MKKRFLAAAGAVLAITLLAGTQMTAFAEEDIPYGHFTVEADSEEPLRLAFLSFQTNPFFLQIKEGYTAVADYLAEHNATVDYINMGEELTSDYVVAGIENAITMEYDGIAVNAIFDGTDEVINKAVDAGKYKEESLGG